MTKIKRKNLGNKLRFEVFKRDLFRCQYCGKTPPSVVLEVDHIHPVSKGGNNEIDNLLTACFECNRGKNKNELTTIPEATGAKTELLKEKELQYIEFQKIQLKIEKRVQKEVDIIEATFKVYYPKMNFLEPFRASVRNFIKHLGYGEVNDSMIKACSKGGFIENPNDAIRYFCGICWNKIKNDI